MEQPVKVLMADDEPEVLEIMARKVRQAGFEVVTADNGNIAWEMINDGDPDIIILDVNMPGKDGFTLLKDLRTRPDPGKWQPVIIVSGRRELEDMKKGFALEADHYITKPCRVEDIIKAIHLMLPLIPQRIKESQNGH